MVVPLSSSLDVHFDCWPRHNLSGSLHSLPQSFASLRSRHLRHTSGSLERDVVSGSTLSANRIELSSKGLRGTLNSDISTAELHSLRQGQSRI